MKRVTPMIPANLPVAPDSDDPGFGALKTAAGLLPLKALEIEAHIVGLARSSSTPFPSRSRPSTSFRCPRAPPSRTSRVNGRRVEGTLMERTAAHEAYREALRAGHRASLAEEDRQDVFTISVGNLPPGEAITVDLQPVSALILGPLASG